MALDVEYTKRLIKALEWLKEDLKYWFHPERDRRKAERRSKDHKPRGSEDARKHPGGSRRVADWVKHDTRR